MSHSRLTKILRSRNIHGVILSPLPEAGSLEHLDWPRWSATALGNSLTAPHIHRVTHHQYHGMSLILENLIRKGYQRIGLAIDEVSDNKVDHTWSSCMAGYQLRIAAKNRVPILRVPREFMPERKEANRKRFLGWLERHRPEVVVGHDALLTWLRELGIRIPQDMAMAHLSLPSDLARGLRLSGLDQNWRRVGAAAVDSVVLQIYHNERGIPEDPRTVMLEGSWVEGDSTPGPRR